MAKRSAAALFAKMSGAAEARFWRRVVARMLASHPDRCARVLLDSLLFAPPLGVALEDGTLIVAVGDE